MILVTPKQEVERKSEWLCGVKIFCSNFKVEWENGVWTKIRFLASGFCSHATISLWFLLFFRFFGSDFFFKRFFQSILVHSRSSFLFSQWKFFELYVRTCPAMFFFISSSRFLLRPYDVTTTWNLLFFIRLCNFNWSACVTSFFALSGASFCSFAWLNFWSHLTYLNVKWVCVSL